MERPPPNEFVSKLQAMMKSNPPPRTRPLPPYPASYPSSNPVPKRLPNGAFPTEVIASILKNATNEAAHAFGARCIPGIMNAVEVIGIEMGRRWGIGIGIGSLNEMRRVLGLKGGFFIFVVLFRCFCPNLILPPFICTSVHRFHAGVKGSGLTMNAEYTSFIEWNHDANVADAAQALYGDINNLELYVRFISSPFPSFMRKLIDLST
jgi:linoleate 10R-lipoxygenase